MKRPEPPKAQSPLWQTYAWELEAYCDYLEYCLRVAHEDIVEVKFWLDLNQSKEVSFLASRNTPEKQIDEDER